VEELDVVGAFRNHNVSSIDLVNLAYSLIIIGNWNWDFQVNNWETFSSDIIRTTLYQIWPCVVGWCWW